MNKEILESSSHKKQQTVEVSKVIPNPNVWLNFCLNLVLGIEYFEPTFEILI